MTYLVMLHLLACAVFIAALTAHAKSDELPIQGGIDPLTKPILPPAIYDHPYSGKITLLRVNKEQMKVVCPLPTQPGHMIYGCAYKDRPAPGNCGIIILDDKSLVGVLWSYEIILRHETGHCNGWHPEHPDMRTLAQAEKEQEEAEKMKQIWGAADKASDFLTPSPPGEKATARHDEAGGQRGCCA